MSRTIGEKLREDFYIQAIQKLDGGELDEVDFEKGLSAAEFTWILALGKIGITFDMQEHEALAILKEHQTDVALG